MKIEVDQTNNKELGLVQVEKSNENVNSDEFADLQRVCEVIQRNEDNLCCRHCGATRIHKHGTRSNLQRYKCTSCHKTFNALTGTPLAHLRKKELWLKYTDHMLQSSVIREISLKLHCDKNTVFRWRHRFSTWLYKDRPNTLEGTIEAGETYLNISHKGCRKLKREVNNEGVDNSSPDLPQKQVCVLVTCDHSEHSLEFITGLGPVKGKWLDIQLASHIAPTAVLVTDELPSYDHFCKKEHIKHKVIKKTKDNDDCYNLKNISAYQDRIKNWINGHFRGVATKYLNHYLWWRHELENKCISTNIDLFKVVLC